MTEIIIVPRDSQTQNSSGLLHSLPLAQIVSCAGKCAELWFQAKQMEQQCQVQQTTMWNSTVQELGRRNQENIEFIENSRLLRTILKPLAEAEGKRLLRRKNQAQDDTDDSIWSKVLQILGLAKRPERKTRHGKPTT